MGKKEQVPALRSLCRVLCGWVWSATSRGRPPDGGWDYGSSPLAVFHMVPRVPAAPNLVVHPPADRKFTLFKKQEKFTRISRSTAKT